MIKRCETARKPLADYFDSETFVLLSCITNDHTMHTVCAYIQEYAL